MVVFEEENTMMGDQCFREVTFWDQLQGHGQKRGKAAVDQP